MSVVVTEKDGNLLFNLRVIPRASKTELAGILGGALKIRIASPPVGGTANVELVRFLAKLLGVARGDITIIAGLTSQNKRIKVANLSQSKLREVTK